MQTHRDRDRVWRILWASSKFISVDHHLNSKGRSNSVKEGLNRITPPVNEFIPNVLNSLITYN